ncbi:MAG: hypothetical protein R3F11_09320 [Verrucomicrobiales bacterium]
MTCPALLASLNPYRTAARSTSGSKLRGLEGAQPRRHRHAAAEFGSEAAGCYVL